jgi:hypothetical protein
MVTLLLSFRDPDTKSLSKPKGFCLYVDVRKTLYQGMQAFSTCFVLDIVNLPCGPYPLATYELLEDMYLLPGFLDPNLLPSTYFKDDSFVDPCRIPYFNHPSRSKPSDPTSGRNR